MRRLAAIFIGVFTAFAAAADGPSELRALMTADDTRGFEAVGRLDIGRRSFCTATLIAPDLVLTAAHCLYDSRTLAPVDIGQISFHAGLRDGRSVAQRRVRRAVVHPAYDYKGPDGEAMRVINDLAILELSQPIRSSVTPLEVRAKPRKGDAVGVVSYAFDRDARPSLQEVCHVLARPRGMLILSCEVDFGSSGAPVLVFEDGAPRIVSVVSAKAEAMDGRPVSIGTELEAPLAELVGIVRSSDGVFERSAAPSVRRIGSDTGGGAKFVRP